MLCFAYLSMLGHLGFRLTWRPLKYGTDALMRSRKGVYMRSTYDSSFPRKQEGNPRKKRARAGRGAFIGSFAVREGG